MSGREGTVFILTNDAMPGFSRVDYTTGDDLGSKISRVNKSALPVPFRLYFAAKVPDVKLVDRNLHYLFADYCDARDAQFFKINPDMLRAAIELAAISVIQVSDKEQGISAFDRAQMDRLRTAHDNVRFEALNAEAGTELYFSRDRTITCTALGNGLVEFDGTAMSPAEASASAMRAIGFDWAEVSSVDYWLSQGDPAARKARGDVIPPDVDHGMPEVPIVPNDADDSPVMFIRSKSS
ncbi:GIY-YIG nuclease family protein [Altererythrobacter arenosus]|uniref:GIY-YIG nuclease family protein n=1 Tax=Altererythrobacter arenosus TaxID=3032592 RepID=A0ABY8FLR1_9SPHN|nr:GIY-YIG nuclease family protein [Altererythrobacter sp. CAU 1644]WFL75956.1 GIY-YIG nuclease family protein [Altererythrobacter sp. CAU 1644]